MCRIVEVIAVGKPSTTSSMVHLGYAVAGQAASGESAIEKVAVARPDLILMDIILQGSLDGVQTVEEILKRYKIPVVFLTAHADDATIRRAQITGPFGYILKPFDERELHVAIEIALYRSQVEARLETLNHELQTALAEIKTLKGLLHICAWCKKIRNDHGLWLPLEAYIEARSEAEFSHGICPDCERDMKAP